MGPTDLPGSPHHPPDRPGSDVPDPSCPEGDDQAVVAAIRSGDLRAFETLFRSYFPRLRAFALTFVESDDVAEDLVEDLFVRIWERREEWTLTSSLDAYLYSALRNRALNHLDRHRRARRLQAEAESEGRAPAMGGAPPTPDEAMARRELEAAVRGAIDALPERAGEAFVLHRFHGKSQAEIAEIMGVSPRTVENHVARAVRHLRESLDALL